MSVRVELLHTVSDRVAANRRATIPALAAAAVVFGLALSAAFAQAQTAPSFPPPSDFLDTQPAKPEARAVESQRRLRLEFPARTVSLNIPDAALTPTIAATVGFAAGSSELTAETRSGLDALRVLLRRDVPNAKAFAILVSGSNEALAHRRAKALRADWIARGVFTSERLVAAALVSNGTAGDDGRVRVEIVTLDPARCGDCGETTLRAIALDSGAARLVRATTDEIATAKAGAPSSISDIVSAPLPPPRPARTEAEDDEVPAPRAKRSNRLAAEAQPARRTANLAYAPAGPVGSWNRGDDGACRRPSIVIDDYWRGGPIINCRGGFRPR
ncbi:hypothetical protein [Bosea sp. PAMC 26642]|uniref:hypothetical protein n=1 Tax=Bosea sp. (strain PAMC 26642) TaxID=1792307 RepID=UPI000AF37CF3|nr:hypothetical protein [Bosea sp. PAMC 26642]